jgi:bifunctional non-homologous end joining protein LigD
LRKHSAGRKKGDALADYRSKRDPARSNEPFSTERGSSAGATAEGTTRGVFVVHLHEARRRHYDLRLQIGSTLMSFAVPRGPSLDPKDKRLAVNTENHPIAYVDFEDVIPGGNYGAGAMIVWDTGNVVYLESSAEAGIERRKIDFELQGYKLRGRYGLIHTGARAKRGTPQAKQWLLVKKKDAHASVERNIVEEEPYSVLSGLTVEQLGRAREVAAELEQEAKALGAKQADMDAAKLVPMLCASKGATLGDDDRMFELKLDGVRIVADRRGSDVELRYRTRRNATLAYPEIARAVAALAPERVVLDGEIVAFDPQGRPSFQRLSRRIHLSRPLDVRRAALEVPVCYLVFDVLQLGEYDLRELPLRARKKLLARLLPGRGLIRALDHIEGNGRALFTFCEENGLEGVIAKEASSRYRSGPRRSSAWVKLKTEREGDFVVVGWEQSDKARKLRSLLVAAYDGDELLLRGKVGSGLDDAAIDWWLTELGGREVDGPTASGTVTKRGKRHWVKPERVVSVAYLELSQSGSLRGPVYRGLREDVTPRQCRLVHKETAIARAAEATASTKPATGMLDAADRAVRATLTNQAKVFWPEEGYTKGDLCNYYASVADALLPLLRGRPIVMVRYPDGIAGKMFYQWHVPRGTPAWLRSLQVREEGERGKAAKRTFLIDDIDGLLHIANLGCIPIHVLAARENTREHCDFLTIDFDIGEQPFRHAVSLALSLREMLDEVGLPSFPKTSGQTGLHVLIPLGPGVRFDAAKMLVELLGRLLQVRHHDIATMERRVEQRGARVYIDTGQTGRSRTIVAPYSVRAVRGATVSTPLSWDEVHMALDPSQHNMFTVAARLRDMPCPMAQLLEVEPDVAAAVAKLEKMVTD